MYPSTRNGVLADRRTRRQNETKISSRAQTDWRESVRERVRRYTYLKTEPYNSTRFESSPVFKRAFVSWREPKPSEKLESIKRFQFFFFLIIYSFSSSTNLFDEFQNCVRAYAVRPVLWAYFMRTARFDERVDRAFFSLKLYFIINGHQRLGRFCRFKNHDLSLGRTTPHRRAAFFERISWWLKNVELPFGSTRRGLRAVVTRPYSQTLFNYERKY